jgi:hypothetical protein
MMTDDDIDRVAKDVLRAFDLEEKLPVDPFLIAKEEDIRVLPGNYDNEFDGRIEYRRESGFGHFYLFFAEEELPFRPQGRVRFSVAHELGHYFLPEHRDRLLAGKSHGSHADFVSKKEREREADRFAARLLMPTDLFEDEVRAMDSYCTLKDLRRLASEVFHTSLTSTIRRYVDLNFEPCCLVLAENGVISWSICSEDMRDQALGWTDWGSRIPSASVTARAVISKLSGANLMTEGPIDSSVWFSRRNSCRLWEEVLLLSSSGRTLTYITPENKPDRFDD